MLLYITVTYGNCNGIREWNKVYGTMAQVVANSHALWSIDAQHKSYYCIRSCTGNWIHIGHNMINIDVDAFFSWGIGFDKLLYRKGWRILVAG